MAVIDITSRLTEAKPMLQLGEDEAYEIDDRKNTILEMQQMLTQASEESEIETVLSTIELVLGKDAVASIRAKHPNLLESFSSVRILFIGIMAAVSGESYEAAEARFRS